jgi:hypothetical protein
MLRLFHDYLHAQGVATTAGDSERPTSGPAVIDPTRRWTTSSSGPPSSTSSSRLADAQAVIEAQMAYFEAIGAVGEPVDEPDDPGLSVS